MCDYKDEGWELFLRQANTLLEENKHIKQKNKELESAVLILKRPDKTMRRFTVYKWGFVERRLQSVSKPHTAAGSKSSLSPFGMGNVANTPGVNVTSVSQIHRE